MCVSPIPRALVLALITTVVPSAMAADNTLVRDQLAHSLQTCQTTEQWAARRLQLRQEFLKGAGLWPLPDREPLQVIRHSQRSYDGYTVENVAIETLPGFWCTGNLYRPIGQKQLQPAVLCPHGHFQPLGRMRKNQQIRCAHLARMGATVFSWSMVGWQECQQTSHDDPQVLTLQTWNSLCAVDFVSSLERVDPERIGVTGASGGGTQALYLTLIDNRIRASAPAVIVYPWSAPDGCLCEGGLPVMQQARTNAIELAAAAAPRPQLLISVGNDATRDFPDSGFPFIQQMYERAGAADAVQNLHLPSEGHDFGPSKRQAVYQFLSQHLQITADAYYAGAVDRTQVPEEDLSRIKIESPEQMRVFDEQHPLPDHALQGGAAIRRQLQQHLQHLRHRSDPGDAIRVQDAPAARYSFRPLQDGDQELLFTPAGFEQQGQPQVAAAAGSARLRITVRDSSSGKPTPCRINVVGPDGHYYEPAAHNLKAFSLNGEWPRSGWGNRPGKAPVRYLGHFFYSEGQDLVTVPSGLVRVEVWKGFDYRPVVRTIAVGTGDTADVTLTLEPVLSPDQHHYWSGDPHIHIQRRHSQDEQQIFGLLAAEDIRYGAILAYNEPAGPYSGRMRTMETPQLGGVGRNSIAVQQNTEILSGQEYRSSTYGHINFFLADQLVLPEQDLDANDWPTFGMVARSVQQEGGIAFYAHGGYAKEVYADVVQGHVDGIELLQFGVYRGIGLLDWYHMWNAGFRIPINGACDYPACRKLGDCRTYVFHEGRPGLEDWLQGMKAGRSFVTTGPILLLDVDGVRPGGTIHRSGNQPRQVTATVRVRSEVAPVTHVQLIANGRVLKQLELPRAVGKGSWIELKQRVSVEDSTWIAARAFSHAVTGTPDAESHTNPVSVIVDERAPYQQASLDRLVEAIDGQLEVHRKRSFAEQAQVLAYFERSRDILMAVRAAGGAPADGHPSDLLADNDRLDPTQLEHSDETLREYLKPVPPLSVAAAVQSFEAVDGFTLQPVATEPLVVDPIAAAFADNGDLYVCEMRDYPYKPRPGQAPVGTLRLLRDTDNDGVFDISHVFADELLWAGGVAVWQGGVFVAAAPDIWYLKDTDGDFHADLREKIYTGFGTGNQQAMLNNLTWGLDHKIYGSTAHNGGLIRTVGGPAAGADPVSVDGHDFRFDPVTGAFEAITGTVQFGNTFDDWGNRFLCSESRPLLHAAIPKRYLARNPWLAAPPAVRSLTDGAVPIHRLSPQERWRIIRSGRRIATGGRSAQAAGASQHVMDAAAGVTVYRGGAWPEEHYGNVLIGGAQNNVIHRRVLAPDGISFQSERAEANTEFVRSSDNWFRPVNFVNAPDGTLYVLDMSREILESIHIPDDVVRFLDLTSGRRYGRIYRIAQPGYQWPGTPQPATLSAAELVQSLESPHGWWRDTAHRLLYERQETSVIPQLRQLLARGSRPQSRLHALWTLQGMQAVQDSDLVTALTDEHAALQKHAIILSEPHLDQNPQLLQHVLALTHHADLRLQVQAAFSLGESRNPSAVNRLAQLAIQNDADSWLRTAALSSAGSHPVAMFRRVLADGGSSDLLQQLARMTGAQGNRSQVDELLTSLAQLPAGKQRTTLLRSAGEALLQSGQHLSLQQNAAESVRRFTREEFQTAVNLIEDENAPPDQRVPAIRMLACFEPQHTSRILRDLMDVSQPEAVQLAAVQGLSHIAEPLIADWLLETWEGQTPKLRQHVIRVLLSRTSWTRTYLQRVSSGEAGTAPLDAQQRSLLKTHRNEEIRRLARTLTDRSPSEDRAAVMATYQPATQDPGDVGEGARIFARTCAGCHRIGKTGHAVGPDLASSPSKERAALLQHILDPNRYVLPNYETYVVVDTSGRSFNGLIATQSGSSLTLKRAENQTDTILRRNIDELAATGLSLMPEGLEKEISVRQMTDLLAFLQDCQVPGDTSTLPVGTLPGLSEPTPRTE